MASSASSPSKPVEKDFNLDELVSELHALKKLYGLLQNNSAIPAGLDQPAAHGLDEKSRHLLKNLLDGATQQALQSQAKIISCTLETTKLQEHNSNPSNNGLQKDVPEAQKFQECHPTAPPIEILPEAAISTSVAQPKITQNLCPMPDPSRRRSKDATVHCSRAKDSARLESRLMSHPSESGSRRRSSLQSKNGSRRLQSIGGGGGLERAPSWEKGDELLTLVPVQKRPRVEPVHLPNRASSQTHKSDRVDRQLTHQKSTSTKQTGPEPNSISSMLRSHSSKHQNMAHKLAEKKTRVTFNKHIKPDRFNRSKAKKLSSSSKRSTRSSSDSTGSPGSVPLDLKKMAPRPPPPPCSTLSRRCHLSFRSPTAPIIQNNDRSAEIKSRANKPIKPAQPNRSREGRYSSSTSSITRPNSILKWSSRSDLFTPIKQSRVKARGRRRASPPAPPKPSIPHHLAVTRWKPPPRTPMVPKLEEDEQGRFKKLKNKLAIIFHHHHHHHHHLHARGDDEGGGGCRKDHERSLWKYLKGVLHVKKGRGEVQRKLHRYNLRVMIEWLFHHLWWKRQRRRRKAERPRLAKKVKWWEWFRRRGGVVVGGRRRIKLRLGFNGSHR